MFLSSPAPLHQASDKWCMPVSACGDALISFTNLIITGADGLYLEISYRQLP